MNRVYDNRWDQLRAVEADLLSPPPEDPFQTFSNGWSRASNLSEEDWERLSRCEKIQSPAPHDPFPSTRRSIRRTPPARSQNSNGLQERRPLRQRNESNADRRHRSPRPEPRRSARLVGNNPSNQNAQPVEPRRPLSPTQLPGVRAIPKDYNRYFRGLLSPGEYFAKSKTRYLGPFETYPTGETLPSDDEYIILQRMGRLPESGKSIFRQVGNLST